MRKFLIKGGKPLCGEVSISGAKNSAVAIIPATILADSPCILENIPDISDVQAMFEILEQMGATVERLDATTYKVDATTVTITNVFFPQVGNMRASYYLLGALLGQKHTANVLMPGGCEFGERPINLHLKGFKSLGADYSVSGGLNAVISVQTEKLVGGYIYMDVVSVGATMNIMLAAVKAEGTTVIENAAREPHVVDLANFLNMMGANIKGAGTSTVKITGVKELHGVTYSIIPDQIEAGTYMTAVAATHGTAVIKNIIPKHLEPIFSKLVDMGIKISINYDEDSITVDATEKFHACDVTTAPHPGFPTDMQPQFVVLLAMAEGTGIIREQVWESRFQYVSELQKTGMNIVIQSVKKKDDFLLIQGGKKLKGAEMTATDLRAGAAMIIAALCTDAESTISNINFIERGYDCVIEKFRNLGADIQRIED